MGPHGDPHLAIGQARGPLTMLVSRVARHALIGLLRGPARAACQQAGTPSAAPLPGRVLLRRLHLFMAAQWQWRGREAHA